MDFDDGSSFRQLQTHLHQARLRLQAGDFDAALESVDRALAIDPQYLAARALHEKITTAKLAAPSLALTAKDSASSSETPVSLDNFAKLEARARHRRVERRLVSARAAIRAGQLGEARAAVSELSELEPDSPDLALLGLELTQAEEAARALPSRRPWLPAGLALVVVILCVGFFERNPRMSRLARSPNTAVLAQQVHFGASKPTPLPQPDDAPAPVATTGPAPEPVPEASEIVSGPSPVTVARSAAAATATAATTQVVRESRLSVTPPEPAPPVTLTPAALPVTLPPTAPAIELPPVAAPLPSPAVAPVSPPSTVPLEPDTIPQQPLAALALSEDRLVRVALQRYRNAYEGLNAKSAQQVWPSVDESALARAFDDLESQSLTFDECAIELHGALATATCHGSTRYTPRTGSREPHVEPRVWSFTLTKNNSMWQIESAKVAR